MKSKFSLLITAFVLIITSCNSGNNKNLKNDLSGEWVLEFKRDGEIPGQLFIWKFEPDNNKSGEYEFYWKADYPVKGDFVVITGEKGKYTIENNILYPLVKTYGSQQAEPMSEVFYDSIVWYKPGNPRFELFQATDSIGIELQGDILKLKMDNNADGSWNGDEISDFKRMKTK
jgi:hypothetical protein